MNICEECLNNALDEVYKRKKSHYCHECIDTVNKMALAIVDRRIDEMDQRIDKMRWKLF